MSLAKRRFVGFKLNSLIHVKILIAIFVILLILASAAIGLFAINALSGINKKNDRPILVLRVDDIQDYAFKEAQLFILNYSIENKLPLSLGIIAGLFGSDREIVEAVKSAIAVGAEVSIHGWQHENLAALSK